MSTIAKPTVEQLLDAHITYNRKVYQTDLDAYETAMAWSRTTRPCRRRR